MITPAQHSYIKKQASLLEYMLVYERIILAEETIVYDDIIICDYNKG